MVTNNITLTKIWKKAGNIFVSLSFLKIKLEQDESYSLCFFHCKKQKKAKI